MKKILTPQSINYDKDASPIQPTELFSATAQNRPVRYTFSFLRDALITTMGSIRKDFDSYLIYQEPEGTPFDNTNFFDCRIKFEEDTANSKYNIVFENTTDNLVFIEKGYNNYSGKHIGVVLLDSVDKRFILTFTAQKYFDKELKVIIRHDASITTDQVIIDIDYSDNGLPLQFTAYVNKDITTIGTLKDAINSHIELSVYYRAITNDDGTNGVDSSLVNTILGTEDIVYVRFIPSGIKLVIPSPQDFFDNFINNKNVLEVDANGKFKYTGIYGFILTGFNYTYNTGDNTFVFIPDNIVNSSNEDVLDSVVSLIDNTSTVKFDYDNLFVPIFRITKEEIIFSSGLSFDSTQLPWQFTELNQKDYEFLSNVIFDIEDSENLYTYYRDHYYDPRTTTKRSLDVIKNLFDETLGFREGLTIFIGDNASNKEKHYINVNNLEDFFKYKFDNNLTLNKYFTVIDERFIQNNFFKENLYTDPSLFWNIEYTLTSNSYSEYLIYFDAVFVNNTKPIYLHLDNIKNNTHIGNIDCNDTISISLYSVDVDSSYTIYIENIKADNLHIDIDYYEDNGKKLSLIFKNIDVNNLFIDFSNQPEVYKFYFENVNINSELKITQNDEFYKDIKYVYITNSNINTLNIMDDIVESNNYIGILFIKNSKILDGNIRGVATLNILGDTKINNLNYYIMPLDSNYKYIPGHRNGWIGIAGDNNDVSINIDINNVPNETFNYTYYINQRVILLNTKFEVPTNKYINKTIPDYKSFSNNNLKFFLMFDTNKLSREENYFENVDDYFQIILYNGAENIDTTINNNYIYIDAHGLFNNETLTDNTKFIKRYGHATTSSYTNLYPMFDFGWYNAENNIIEIDMWGNTIIIDDNNFNNSGKTYYNRYLYPFFQIGDGIDFKLNKNKNISNLNLVDLENDSNLLKFYIYTTNILSLPKDIVPQNLPVLILGEYNSYLNNVRDLYSLQTNSSVFIDKILIYSGLKHPQYPPDNSTDKLFPIFSHIINTKNTINIFNNNSIILTTGEIGSSYDKLNVFVKVSDFTENANATYNVLNIFRVKNTVNNNNRCYDNSENFIVYNINKNIKLTTSIKQYFSSFDDRILQNSQIKLLKTNNPFYNLFYAVHHLDSGHEDYKIQFIIITNKDKLLELTNSEINKKCIPIFLNKNLFKPFFTAKIYGYIEEMIDNYARDTIQGFLEFSYKNLNLDNLTNAFISSSVVFNNKNYNIDIYSTTLISGSEGMLHVKNNETDKTLVIYLWVELQEDNQL